MQSVSEYLKTYGPKLAERVMREAQPLVQPGQDWHPRVQSLLREPFPAQGDAITALSECLKEHDSALVVGEMGTGKTLMGAAVPYVSQAQPPRVLVMCPGHLVRKWRREILQTIPGAKAVILKKLPDVMALDPSLKPERPEYYVLSKEKAKLGFAWRAAFRVSGRNGFLHCPSCGAPILDGDGVPVEPSFLQKNRRSCPECGQPLWQADGSRFRRYALSEYIKRHLKGFFGYFIADEVHELKGGQTAQGNSFGALASACGKTLALTGTLLGGYADDLFYILFRLSPGSLKAEDLSYSKVSEWMSRYGVLERVYRVRAEDNACSRGRKTSATLKRKPGLSPLVFARHLMERCAFLHLEDIAPDLPPIEEEVISLSMGNPLHGAYKELEGKLVEAVREALARGSKALLGTYLNTLLSYPDRPFGNAAILDPQDEEKVIARPEELSREETYPKEERLLGLVQEELGQGRRVFVFCQYTGTKDVTGRLKELFLQKGIRAEILRSAVPPETREDWVKERVTEGVQVLIANPKLVETGLDLLEFPTIVFFQTGYSVYTLRQASRRSWRIGQTEPVRVYYLAYQGTMQERALQLMGSKLEASLAVEGKFSEEGLLAMTSGEDMTTLMAKALVEGLEVEGAGEIWRKVNRRNVIHLTVGVNPIAPVIRSVKSDIESPAPSLEEPRVIHVDLLRGGLRRKTERLVLKAEELEETLAGQERAAVQLALFG